MPLSRLPPTHRLPLRREERVVLAVDQPDGRDADRAGEVAEARPAPLLAGELSRRHGADQGARLLAADDYRIIAMETL